MRVLTLCLLVIMLVPMVASAAPMTSNSGTMPKAFTTGAFGSNDVPEGKSPITGLDWTGDYRPVVVQISNAAGARPHWNMSEADVVYEAIYWGPAHTRYTMIYSDNHPDYVGSVRSARVFNCDIRQEWDGMFVFFGGQQDKGTSIYDYFTLNNVTQNFRIDGTRGDGKYYTRETTRVSPHNAVVNLQMVVDAWPTNEDGTPHKSKSHAFKFSNTPSYGSDSAKEIHVVYDEKDYYPHYTFNATDRVYERWYNGEEQVDGKSGKRIVASNVIIQFAEMGYHANSPSRPTYVLTGTGVMDAFIDGRHIRGSWIRNGINDRTIFLDMNGEEITMLPGKTFIQILPRSSSFTYVTNEGTSIEMDFGADVPTATFDTSITDADIDKMEE